jgi:hypothetical protein
LTRAMDENLAEQTLGDFQRRPRVKVVR